MKTELDNVKSSITVTLGTKNRMRTLKGSKSYEDYINYLIRLRNHVAHKMDNTIELQKFERRKAIHKLEMKDITKNSTEFYNILFSYNEYNNSPNFRFDIKIETIRSETGRKVSVQEFLKEISLEIFDNMQNLMIQYKVYFNLLESAIQKSIDHQFRHKGRFEDYYLWNEELQILNLPDKTFEEDIMEKLSDFKSGIGVFS